MNWVGGWISTKKPLGCAQWDKKKDHVTFFRGLVLLQKEEYEKVRDPLKRVTKLVDPKDKKKILGFRVYRVSELLQRQGKPLNELTGWDLLDMADEENKRLYNKLTIGPHLCMKQDQFLKGIRDPKRGMVGFTLPLSNATH